jgi:hypothetical protein
MKKILVFTGVALLVLALGAYVTLQFFLGSIVTAGVNKFGPAMTQSKVQLDSATLSPLSGVGTLTGLTVGNPQGWSNANALHLGKIHVDVEPFSLFKDHIVINEITIDQAEVVYETKIVASNIGDLLKNIEQSMGGNKAAEPTTETGKPVKMVVKKFVLRNTKVTVGMGATAIALPMPPVELTDLGVAENGITPAAVAFAVMRSITSSVISTSTKGMTELGGTAGAAAADAVKKGGEALKGLFGGKK